MAFSVTTLPLYGQGGSYSAQMDRMFVKAAAGTAGTRKLTAAAGTPAQATGDFAVTTSATAASVTIAAGEIMLAALTGSGFYFAVNDAPITLSGITANSSGSTRYDLIVVRVTDTGAAPTVTTAIVTGTAGGSIPSPTVTSTTIETPLASITVPSGFTTGTLVAAGNITDARRKGFLPDLSVQGTTTATIPAPTSGNLVYDDTLKQWKGYNGTAWTIMQATPFICTSSTRPTGSQLTDGLTIYETDTNETLTYYATPAVWRRPWRQPWGYITSASTTTATTVSATANTLTDMGPTVTWTAVANRTYKVSVLIGTAQTTNQTLLTTQFANSANTKLADLAATHIGGLLSISQSGFFIATGLTAGSQTVKIRASANTASSGVVFQNGSFPSVMTVEDIGPNGNPA